MAERLFRTAQFLLTLLVGYIAAQDAASGAEPHSDEIDFNRDIRPILSDNCFACHGPDEKERQAGLRLDLRANATKAAESGAIAIVPGKVEASELIQRVISTDEATRMPPLKGKHKPLTASQIKLLKRWVASGAEYSSHWAFKAPERPSVPEVDAVRFRVRNEIDRFVVAKLLEHGTDHDVSANGIPISSRPLSSLAPSPRRGGLGRGDEEQSTPPLTSTPLPGPPH